MDKKIIYLSLGIIIALIIVVIFAYLGSRTSPQPEETGETGETGVLLSLAPKQGSYEIGETFSLDIVLDTKEREVSGVDVWLRYEPEILEIVEGKDYKKDSVFAVWPMNLLVEDGLIKFSALTQPGEFFSGKGKVGTLYFKGLSSGTAEISFIFEKDSTLDTNVASEGRDMLDKVINGSYQIK